MSIWVVPVIRHRRVERRVHVLWLAAVVMWLACAGAEAATAVRIGNQASGTFGWVLYAMEHFGIDKEYGLRLQTTTYATKQAAEIALRAGEVDIAVDDFINTALMRSRGIPIKAVYPYSLATGEVVVPAGSGIKGLADLKGKRIAAASLGDKSLLILRALTSSQYGFDPQVDGATLSASPPLMSELLDRGEMDAAIPYWHFAARMIGSGQYRSLMSVTDMLAALGLSTDLPILVIVARDKANPDMVRTFLRAFQATTKRMQSDDGIWQAILDEELYSLPDPSLFPSVRAAWVAGLPRNWTRQTIDGLVRLTERLVAVAGEDVVGVARVDPATFSMALAP